MSAPIRDHRANGGLSTYAPKRALPEQNHTGSSGRAKEPSTPPEFSEPPWRRKGEPAFSGDVANVALRKRLAESCDEVPVPFLVEVPRARRPLRRLLGAVALVGVGVTGYWWGSGPPHRAAGPNLAPASDRAEMAARRSPQAETSAPRVATRVDVEPTQDLESTRSGAAGRNGDAPSAGLATPVAAATAMPDPSEPVASSLPRAVPTTPEWGAGTQSAPSPPPQGSSALPEPAIAMSVGTGERKAASIDDGGGAAGAKAAPRKLGEAEIALMINRGSLLMANGSVGAARMMLQPAADAGSSAAAFALAETYDPLVLDKLGAKGGITPDVALANAWYERARDLGSTVAPGRIEMLARLAE